MSVKGKQEDTLGLLLLLDFDEHPANPANTQFEQIWQCRAAALLRMYVPFAMTLTENQAPEV